MDANAIGTADGGAGGAVVATASVSINADYDNDHASWYASMKMAVQGSG